MSTDANSDAPSDAAIIPTESAAPDGGTGGSDTTPPAVPDLSPVDDGEVASDTEVGPEPAIQEPGANTGALPATGDEILDEVAGLIGTVTEPDQTEDTEPDGFEDISQLLAQAEAPELAYGLEGTHRLLPDFTADGGFSTTGALVVVSGLGVPFRVRYHNTAQARGIVSRLAKQARSQDVFVQVDGLGNISSDGIEIGQVAPWNSRPPAETMVAQDQLDGTPALYPANITVEPGAGGPIMIMMPVDELGGGYVVSDRGRTAFGGKFFGLVSKCRMIATRSQNADPARALRLFNALALWLAQAYPCALESKVVETEEGPTVKLRAISLMGEAMKAELGYRMAPETRPQAQSISSTGTAAPSGVTASDWDDIYGDDNEA